MNQIWTRSKLERAESDIQFSKLLQDYIQTESMTIDDILHKQYIDITTIIRYINEIGWDKILNINDDFTLLTIGVRDNSNRKHIINIELPSRFPYSKPLLHTSLPLPIYFIWNDSYTLKNIVDVIQIELMKLEKYFEVI
jgi:hypothetical protein